MSLGWIGTKDQLFHALATFKAERDADGQFLISGEEPMSFMGAGDEYIISDRVLCRINGNWVPVAGLLNSTSYGLRVNVI